MKERMAGITKLTESILFVREVEKCALRTSQRCKRSYTSVTPLILHKWQYEKMYSNESTDYRNKSCCKTFDFM